MQALPIDPYQVAYTLAAKKQAAEVNLRATRFITCKTVTIIDL